MTTLSLDRRLPVATIMWSNSSGATPDLNRSPLEQHPDVQSARAELLDEREKEGRCLSCGQRLFDVKLSHCNHDKLQRRGLVRKLFRKKQPEDASSTTPTATTMTRTPLTIPGRVERGQCLVCCPSSAITMPQTSLVSAQHHQGGGEGNHHKDNIRNNGGTAIYKGEFNVYGERDGHGELTWDNGDKYVGSFFNGKMHGTGSLFFADNAGEYIGEWECGMQHGTGTRRYANGDCYSGDYVNGKRTGQGRFYFANGDMYTGQWENGVMQGTGRYYYNSGQRFEGTFARGKRTGKGKLQRTNGSIDIGLYVNDIRTGLGVRWNADRTMAWKMCNGTIQHKISVPEAVALDYDIEAAALALERIA